MKAEVTVDPDGWVYINLEAESAKEAGQLVTLAMNANADTKRVCNVFATPAGVHAGVSLKTRTDRSFTKRHQQRNRVPFRT
mgnify:FL=1